MGNYGRFPLAFSRGEGSWIWDESGKRYLDFATGIAVCSIGHCHPAMQRALREQSAKLIHCSNLYQIREQAELAQFIVERVVKQPGRVFFCNSGAEANDSLIKLARKFGHDSAAQHGGELRNEVITCTNSFHGRTLGGIAATGQDKVKHGFTPLLEGFKHVPFNDSEALRAAVGPKTSAILFEVVQGEGGINVVSQEFLKTVEELRREHNLLVMLDEVQCGFGRTGRWNAWETAMRGADWTFEPDAVSWAKGMGGGFPIGGIWASERLAPGGVDFRVCDILGPGTHGSTFGGTPLGSVVSLSVLKTIESENLIENADRLGALIRSTVTGWEHPLIREVRGLGLLIGFAIDPDALAAKVPAFAASGQTPSLFVVNRLIEAGMLTVPAGPGVVRWLPPLNVSEDEVAHALNLMRGALDALLNP
ncbi:MAG: acetylornithine transaminase [Verrucomicrobiae bacterium]|nr:acetylornithine transaminase [Verrucomicrobiae bacterium]